MSDVWEEAHALQEELVRLRRAIHAEPELGFRELKTAKLVANTLESLGYRVRTGVGGTGVMGELGEGPPCIAIRADMDALPIQELNEVPYRSRVSGVMHACGHDSHVAMALGAAMLLARQTLPGRVRFLFQPSEEQADEEGVSGAARMIEDGALEGVDVVIAQHVDPEKETGTIQVSAGPIAATEDTFRATIRGEGCHGASPHSGRDPIYLAGQVIGAIHGIVSRYIDPMKTAVVTIGTIHGGTQSNIIPGEVTMTGTIRSFEDEVREVLHRELRHALEVARALGGEYDLAFNNDAIVLANAAPVSELIAQVARDLVGEERVTPQEAGMGAEDFGYMTRVVPGAMFSLGTRKGELRVAHNPRFDIDEAALPVGTAVLVETARRYLRARDAGRSWPWATSR